MAKIDTQKKNSSEKVKHKEPEQIDSPQVSLGEFLFNSPFLQSDLDLDRDKDPGRKYGLFDE